MMGEEEQLLNNTQGQQFPHKPRQLHLSDILDTHSTAASADAAEHERTKGRLKIFLGAAAGVGKTYAMLEEAQGLRAQGRDIVIGYVELHGRDETERLLAGLEVIPRKEIGYRGTVLQEMDTDAIIARKPALALVDELAHTNPQGMHHEKRYEDIEEILEHGIDVYSTVNIQHLESLNDRVFELTGTRVRETFPDRLFDLADEVVLIDLPPNDLRERIRQGKVYRPEKIEQALQNFFNVGNLVSLRELALREAADAVETSAPRRSLQAAVAHPQDEVHTAHSYILICVALKPQDSRVIRQGWRFSRRLNAPAEVINVRRADTRTVDEEQKIAPLRRLARSLNLPFRELSGEPAEQVVAEARDKQATLIVLGESTRSTLYERFFGTFTDKVLRNLDGVDIYIVGDPARRPPV